MEKPEGTGGLFICLKVGIKIFFVVYKNGMERRKARTESENTQKMVGRPERHR